MPLTDEIFLSFIAEDVGRVDRFSVENWVAGIKIWHAIHNTIWPAKT